MTKAFSNGTSKRMRNIMCKVSMLVLVMGCLGIYGVGYGQTPLTAEAEKNDADLVKLLMEARENEDTKDKAKSVNVPTVGTAQPATVGDDVKEDTNALLLKVADAMKSTRLSDIKKLIEQIGDVDYRHEGKTLLMVAIEKKYNRSVAEVLINAGSNVKAIDNKRKTVMMYAKDLNDKIIIKWLTDKGACEICNDTGDCHLCGGKGCKSCKKGKCQCIQKEEPIKPSKCMLCDGSCTQCIRGQRLVCTRCGGDGEYQAMKGAPPVGCNLCDRGRKPNPRFLKPVGCKTCKETGLCPHLLNPVRTLMPGTVRPTVAPTPVAPIHRLNP